MLSSHLDAFDPGVLLADLQEARTLRAQLSN
jgi:hypothetical protein